MTRDPLPSKPDFGEELKSCHPCNDTLTLLARRRSTAAGNMTAPGPSAAQLDDLLHIATRVPDHGKLAPWRFIVFEGEARDRFGNLLRKCFAAANPDATEELLEFEQSRPIRAP